MTWLFKLSCDPILVSKCLQKYVHFGGVFLLHIRPFGGLKIFCWWCKQQGVYTYIAYIAHPECRKNLPRWQLLWHFWAATDFRCKLACCEKLEGTRCFHLSDQHPGYIFRFYRSWDILHEFGLIVWNQAINSGSLLTNQFCKIDGM